MKVHEGCLLRCPKYFFQKISSLYTNILSTEVLFLLGLQYKKKDRKISHCVFLYLLYFCLLCVYCLKNDILKLLLSILNIVVDFNYLRMILLHLGSKYDFECYLFQCYFKLLKINFHFVLEIF